jgi:hypothetical protein
LSDGGYAGKLLLSKAGRSSLLLSSAPAAVLKETPIEYDQVSRCRCEGPFQKQLNYHSGKICCDEKSEAKLESHSIWVVAEA